MKNESTLFTETDKVYWQLDTLWFTDSHNTDENSLEIKPNGKAQIVISNNSVLNVNTEELKIHFRTLGVDLEYELRTTQLKMFISKESFNAIRLVYPSISFVDETLIKNEVGN